MRLRHGRAPRRPPPATAGPRGARGPRTGRRTSHTTSLRQIPAGDLVREGQGIHHAGFFRSFGGVMGAASSRRPFLVCAAVKPCVRRDEEPSPVWVKCLVASNGLPEDRPGSQPSRYLRSAARRTAMATDQVFGRPLPLLFAQAARLPCKPATGGITAIG